MVGLHELDPVTLVELEIQSVHVIGSIIRAGSYEEYIPTLFVSIIVAECGGNYKGM